LPSASAQSSSASDFGVVRSFTFNNLQFAREGAYSFVISVDGDPVSRLRFTVRERAATRSERE
jgi:hypothetical protein